MGRVRRYKKIKSCDTFAKKKSSGTSEVGPYDEPPSMFRERRKKAEKLRTKGMDGEDLEELMLQREALRELSQKRELGVDTSGKRKQKQLEGKKEGESMKAFKRRIRQETRKTLYEELSKTSATSLKRKEKAKERKKKKKELKERNKSGGNKDHEDSLEFHQAEDGRIRPSDRGGPATFPSRDVAHSSPFIAQTVDRPPEIDKEIKSRLSKRKRDSNGDNNGDEDGDTSNSMLGIRGMKLIRLSNASVNSDSNGSSAGTHSSSSSSSSKKGPTNVGASVNEMEQMRERVQEAYKLVKQRRKNGNSNRLYTM